MNEARRCEHCNVPLVELDAYGKRLRGCLGCNRWQVVNGVSYQRTPLLRWREWALIGVGGGRETMPAFDPKFSVRVAGTTSS
jgi:hypothetical protein